MIKTVEPREQILRLKLGQEAPPGLCIVRILQTDHALVGPGTNYEQIFTVVARSFGGVSDE